MGPRIVPWGTPDLTWVHKEKVPRQIAVRISVTHSAHVFCDRLLNRCMATWNLFVRYYTTYKAHSHSNVVPTIVRTKAKKKQQQQKAFLWQKRRYPYPLASLVLIAKYLTKIELNLLKMNMEMLLLYIIYTCCIL